MSRLTLRSVLRCGHPLWHDAVVLACLFGLLWIVGSAR